MGLLQALFGTSGPTNTRPQVEFEDDWRIVVISENRTQQLRINPVDDDVGVYVVNNIVNYDILVPERMWRRGQVTLENNTFRKVETYSPEDSDASMRDTQTE